MKKITSFLLALALVGLIVGPSGAKADHDPIEIHQDTQGINPPSEEQRTDRREELKDKVEENLDRLRDRASTTRQNIEERRDATKERLAQHHRDRLVKHVDTIIKRFEAAVSRLDKLSSRIAQFITKLDERSVDTTEAKSLLAIANAKITEAKSALADLPGALDEIAADGLDRDDITLVREAMSGVKAKIKAAHAALVDVVRNLKPGLNRTDKKSDGDSADDDIASSTDSTTDSN